jgi:hypothetical protein
MKKIISTIILLFTVSIMYAQKATSTEKWIGTIGKEKCTMQYTIYEKEGKRGYEEEITYKGFITIGTKKIPITGWFEGNTMRFDEMINGKKVYTIYFDLSAAPENGYEFIGKRTIKGKVSIINLNKAK